MISILVSRDRDSKILGKIFGWALVIGLATTLTIPNGTGIWPAVFSLAGLTMLVGRLQKTNHEVPRALTNSNRLLVLTAALTIVVPLSIDILHKNPISLDPYITLILLPFLAVVVVRFQLQPSEFFVGVLLAAISTGILATYQHFFQDIGRARGFMNPIPFGDVCVVFAVTLLIRASSVFKQSVLIAFVYFIAAAVATYASLLSGSKGGWLALSLCSTIIIWRFLDSLGVAKLRRLAALTALLMFVVLITPDWVKNRIESGAHGAINWISTGNISEGSVSARFELWTWGVLGFKQSPLIGMSQEDLRRLRVEASKDGRLDPKINDYPDTQDNEYIDQLANRGFIGFCAMILTLIVPFFVFRKFRMQKNREINDLATAGQMLPIMFAEFGISVSLWGTSTFRLVYVSWIVLLLALITVQLSTRQQSESKG